MFIMGTMLYIANQILFLDFFLSILQIVPFRLQFKCRTQDHELDKLHHQSGTGSSSSGDHVSTDFIWWASFNILEHILLGFVFSLI